MTYAHSIKIIQLPRLVNSSAIQHFADFFGEYAVDQSAQEFVDELVDALETVAEAYTTESNQPMVDEEFEASDYGVDPFYYEPFYSDRYDSDIEYGCDCCNGYMYLDEDEDEESECDYGCDAVPNASYAPAISCDVHGYMFDRHHEEMEELAYREYGDEHLGACQYSCERVPNMRCGHHGHVYDIPEYAGYANWYDYHDDNFGHTDEYFDEFAEFYTNLFLREMPALNELEPRWWNESRRHFAAKDKAHHRYALNTSSRNTRREGSVSNRGRASDEDPRRYEPGRTEYSVLLKKKHAAY